MGTAQLCNAHSTVQNDATESVNQTTYVIAFWVCLGPSQDQQIVVWLWSQAVSYDLRISQDFPKQVLQMQSESSISPRLVVIPCQH